MAMNKKEQAAFDALKREVLIAKAFRFTEPVSPDVPPPKGGGLSTGFLFNAYDKSVCVACSSSISHGLGQIDRTTRQNPRWLYSTKERALRALRYELERDYVESLAKIDAQIEAECDASQPKDKP